MEESAGQARTCPPWLADQRDDIVQNALLRVMKVLEREEEGIRTASYLWRVAYSAVVTEIRKQPICALERSR